MGKVRSNISKKADEGLSVGGLELPELGAVCTLRSSGEQGKRREYCHRYLVSWSLSGLAPRNSSALALPGHWSSFAQAHRSDPWIGTAISSRCRNPRMDCAKLPRETT